MSPVLILRTRAAPVFTPLFGLLIPPFFLLDIILSNGGLGKNSLQYTSDGLQPDSS